MKKMNIAIVAHDGRKKELLTWVGYNIKTLSEHNIYATGTTGKLIQERFGKNINKLLSGPLGGDQQIGAMIAEHKIDCLIFFCDNLITQGHQQDISALSRLASLYNIAFATNRTTADMIISSPLFSSDEYNIITPDCISAYAGRDMKYIK